MSGFGVAPLDSAASFENASMRYCLRSWYAAGVSSDAFARSIVERERAWLFLHIYHELLMY